MFLFNFNYFNRYDYDKPAGVIPKGVLKTAKNINKMYDIYFIIYNFYLKS